jgi:transcriptional regulator with XRE-family HTH domain
MTPLMVEIKPLRERKGWTQAQLAQRAGVTRATVNRIENGRPRSIDLDVLEKLGKALGVSPGLLIARV